MPQLILAITAAAVVAFSLYLLRERAGGWGVALAFLRTAGLAALFLVLLNPVFVSRADDNPTTVLLDASLSMGQSDARWRSAVDTALGLAGSDGTVLRFGSAVRLFDSTPPAFGASRVRDALLAGVGSGGPIVVVTDGEIGDASVIPPRLLAQTGVVRLARDTVPDAALLDVAVPPFADRDDSLRVGLTVGAWGALEATEGELEILVDGEPVASRRLALPQPPGVVRRRVVLPPGLLSVGANLISFRMNVVGDSVPADDRRERVITVSQQPGVVVLVDPADWEGRFLAREVAAVARTSVRGFARVGDDRWIDMWSSAPVSVAEVDASVRGASLLIARGPTASRRVRGPTWRWPADSDLALELFAGDWYTVERELASPLAGRLAGVRWDSLPPLSGVVPLTAGEDGWTAIAARLGRRGAERPILIGRDSSGVRLLTTVGSGLWRWALRGGASLEAYRAVVSAGIDWLLGSDVLRRRAPLAVTAVVPRGAPIRLSWQADSLPEEVRLRIEGADSTWTQAIPLDASGAGSFHLAPGSYRWVAEGLRDTRGVMVVEEYSAEFTPQPVTLDSSAALRMGTSREAFLRDRWWLFLIVVAAFAGEWALRQKRGLP